LNAVRGRQGDQTLLAQPPTLRMDGRVAWITGASRGLGRAIAYAFAGAGAPVLLSARTVEPLEAIQADIVAAGGSAQIAVGSVTDPELPQRAMALAAKEWGRLDALVNNAAISPSFDRSDRIDLDGVRDVLETNLLAATACSQAAVEMLEADGGGAIVNVSSIHGTLAHQRMLAYSLSKGGLEMLTRTLAVEWAERGVRVNSLAPAYVKTDLSAGLTEHPHWGESLRSRTPLGRFATVAEIAACALFLAAPVSSYVTGATLFADGGWSAQ
jgi:NAD(P)-dependent dehydrogenase (short-subunit alcohol dehydrogenase family)